MNLKNQFCLFKTDGVLGILHYHKCKVEYIELRVMKVILIRVIKGKK